MRFDLTKGADGSFNFVPVGSSWTPPAPAPVPTPTPSPGSSGDNMFIEMCTPAHKDAVATFPVVFSNTTGEGYSRFTSKEQGSASGGNVKTCFSVPFKVLPSARSSGANMPSFEIAPYQNSASYDVSISQQAGVFGEGSEVTAMDQGTSPSISVAMVATDKEGVLVLPAGDYFFNVGWAGQLAGFLAKPNGFNNNMSVIVRGADSL